jgi:hypothetical protein
MITFAGSYTRATKAPSSLCGLRTRSHASGLRACGKSSKTTRLKPITEFSHEKYSPRRKGIAQAGATNGPRGRFEKVAMRPVAPKLLLPDEGLAHGSSSSARCGRLAVLRVSPLNVAVFAFANNLGAGELPCPCLLRTITCRSRDSGGSHSVGCAFSDEIRRNVFSNMVALHT